MKIFVDTSAWFALYEPAEVRHGAARRFFEREQRRSIELFTSDYILDESLTLIRFKINHAAALAFGRKILGSHLTHLIEVNRSIRDKAWEYFRRHSDQSYSFTDCTSFVLMRQLHIRCAFAFDDHFRHVGFTLLPVKADSQPF